ncbi:uncharacterized protein LOC143913542 [Arctopsyche grandis]|uniref:uncharacterized protein LOC143913542 n=1 Tax=Arctopsyche grandis TaxID=121162 RepID=UPI00406D6D59
MEPTQFETKQRVSSESEVASCEANNAPHQQQSGANDQPHSIWCNYIIMKEVIKNLAWSGRKEARCVSRLWSGIVHELDTNSRDLLLHHFWITHSGSLPVRDRGLKLSSTRLNCIEPEIVIIFSMHKRAHHPFPGSIIDLPHPYTDRMSTVFEHLVAKFFRSVNNIVGVSSDQIFHGSKDTPAARNVLSSGLSIPKIPGVSVQTVNITKDEYKKDYEICSHIEKIMDKEIIKCLLIFSTNHRYELQEKYVEKMISDIDERQRKSHPTSQFAAGGCLVRFSHDQTLRRSDLAGRNLVVIVFSVSKSDCDKPQFDAYSTVFSYYSNSNDDTMLNFKHKLQKMSRAISLRQHSVCVKLSCFKRKSMFDRESVLFAEHFPNMPIVGCDARGEMGIECMPDEVSDDEEPHLKKLRSMDNDSECFHAFSTVILILTWGPLL